MSTTVNNYACADETAVQSAKRTVERLLAGFKHKPEDVLPLGYLARYSYWVNVERFWYWFKKFDRGGWFPREKLLEQITEEVTFHHYPDMARNDIENEVKEVLASFLFESGKMSEVDPEKFERFVKYLQSLKTALS